MNGANDEFLSPRKKKEATKKHPTLDGMVPLRRLTQIINY